MESFLGSFKTKNKSQIDKPLGNNELPIE